WCGWSTVQDTRPKEMMHALLTSDNKVPRYRHRLWGMAGWRSTLDILHRIKNTAKQSPEGLQVWKSFVLAEAQVCNSSDMAAKPHSYFSTNKITSSFFETKEMQAHNTQIQSDMPFLYGVLYPQLLNATLTQGFLSTGGPCFDIWEDM
ncbi:hypothetical protein DFH28DRAFT_880667, partial [Melampsora americana]